MGIELLFWKESPSHPREVDQVTTHYLRDALVAALAGEKPPIADTPAVGCTIKRRG